MRKNRLILFGLLIVFIFLSPCHGDGINELYKKCVVKSFNLYSLRKKETLSLDFTIVDYEYDFDNMFYEPVYFFADSGGRKWIFKSYGNYLAKLKKKVDDTIFVFSESLGMKMPFCFTTTLWINDKKKEGVLIEYDDSLADIKKINLKTLSRKTLTCIAKNQVVDWFLLSIDSNIKYNGNTGEVIVIDRSNAFWGCLYDIWDISNKNVYLYDKCEYFEQFYDAYFWPAVKNNKLEVSEKELKALLCLINSIDNNLLRKIFHRVYKTKDPYMRCWVTLGMNEYDDMLDKYYYKFQFPPYVSPREIRFDINEFFQTIESNRTLSDLFKMFVARKENIRNVFQAYYENSGVLKMGNDIGNEDNNIVKEYCDNTLNFLSEELQNVPAVNRNRYEIPHKFYCVYSVTCCFIFNEYFSNKDFDSEYVENALEIAYGEACNIYEKTSILICKIIFDSLRDNRVKLKKAISEYLYILPSDITDKWIENFERVYNVGYKDSICLRDMLSEIKRRACGDVGEN